jgi:glycosyltransferase involved in cell wall biosynthesis
MPAIELSELPAPPPGRTGWPWTQTSDPLAPALPDGSCWPRLAIVTPSYNQGDFLEETIRSVLLQGYPDLEYVLIDGGSTDHSREIIEKYSPWLSHWVSEVDRGQYHAINKGFAKTSGEIMAWLNSDDKYAPNAFAAMGQVFSQFPSVEWVSSLRRILWDAEGREMRCRPLPGFSREAFWSGEYGVGPFQSAWIQQESTCWRRSLWERAGHRVDDSLQMAGDFELWTRFYQHAQLYGIVGRLGGFRVHAGQKTELGLPLYLEEAKKVFVHRGGQFHSRPKALLRKCIARLPHFVRRHLLVFGLALVGDIIVYNRAAGNWKIERTSL